MDTWEPRITTEDFDLVNGNRGLAFVTINGQAGFTAFKHPFICELVGFTCSWEEFQRYTMMPWPELTNAVAGWDFQSPIYDGPPPLQTPEEKTTGAMLALAEIAAAHRGSNVR
jgi:hypothetical protein